METAIMATKPHANSAWGEFMIEPEEVTAIRRLKALGWGTRMITKALRISKNTVM